MILHPANARRTSISALVAGLVIATMVAACGGGGGSGNDGVVSLASPTASPDPSGSPAAPVDPEEAMQAFTACMKEHGVDVQVGMVTSEPGGGVVSGPSLQSSDPGAIEPQSGGITEFDPKAMEEADKACRDLLPSGMMGDPGATIPPEQVEQMLAFAACMREHGIDMPDPQFSGGGMTVQIGAPGTEGGSVDGGLMIDPMSEEFQAAQEACGSALPGGGPFVIGGSSSTEVQP